ncbi:MAG: DUF3750 domain-containing protein [Deltaproteobacteria bacterium]|nr:DUF3750 domain-containing protein [Deltaproteobacteria bacterium]
MLKELRGFHVESLIDEVQKTVRNYPWQYPYCVFSGPNSNSFTAWIARQVPQLNLDLPFSLIGSGNVH